MPTRIAVRSRAPGGPGARPAAWTVLLALLAGAALAGEPPATAAHDFDTGLAVSRVLAPLPLGERGLASAVMPDQAVPDDAAAAAPADELAAGLGMQVDRNRRKFRAKAIDWVMDRSVAVGHLADFLVGGADSGWHLTVDPRGEDQYTLQWQARFH